MTSAALAIQPQPDSVYSVDKPESWVELDTVNLAELEGPREAPLHFLRLSYQNCIRNEQIHYFMRRVYQVNDESQIEDNSQSIHELSPMI